MTTPEEFGVAAFHRAYTMFLEHRAGEGRRRAVAPMFVAMLRTLLSKHYMIDIRKQYANGDTSSWLRAGGAADAEMARCLPPVDMSEVGNEWPGDIEWIQATVAAARKRRHDA